MAADGRHCARRRSWALALGALGVALRAYRPSLSAAFVAHPLGAARSDRLRAGLPRYASAAAAEAAEGPDDGEDQAAKAPQAKGFTRPSSLRERLQRDIDSQASGVVVPRPDQKIIVQEEVDLNGIDWVTCILGSIPTFAISYGMWTFTGRSAEYFVEHPVDTDFYPAQRLGIVFQTAIVGLSSLAAGIFGFTALGIFLLGIRVAFGVFTGELDPNKQDTAAPRQSTAEKVRDILTRDPVDVVMENRRKKAIREEERAEREARRRG